MGSLTTITCGKKFTGITTGSIIGYTQTGSSFSDESLNRVVDIDPSGDSMTVTGISTVKGECTGGLPTSALNTTLSLKVPTISDSEKSGLFAPLPDVNISDVNLSGSNLLVSKQLTGESTDGSGDMTFSLSDATGISTGFYETYDPADILFIKVMELLKLYHQTSFQLQVMLLIERNGSKFD